jgi:hypothetical protein
MNSYHKCDRQTLIGIITEVVDHLENGSVTGLFPSTVAAFIADLTTDRDNLITEDNDAVQKQAAAKQATARARARQRKIAKSMTRLRYTMIGHDSPDSSFETIFGAPPRRRSALPVAETPVPNNCANFKLPPLSDI